MSEFRTSKSYAEACVNEYSAAWGQAMDKEYRGLASAGTFGDMLQPDGLNIISANGCSPGSPTSMPTWFERRRHWWREVLSRVKVVISLRLSPRRPPRLVLVCWVLLRASWD